MTVAVGARFCPRCAAGLAGPPPTRCGACGYALYVNPRPTGSVIIVGGDTFLDACERNQHYFLALRRAREPQCGRWALPGGFCDGWEHPRDTAVREAREELGLEVRLDHFVGMYLGEYAYQDELLPVLDCFWLASIVSGHLRPDPVEASEHGWFPLADPPVLAFETMNRAMPDARARLEGIAAGN